MDVEIYEFEPGRWSYKIGGAPSGETFPSREAALIAAEQVSDRQAQAQEQAGEQSREQAPNSETGR